ncbi:MAG: DOPA 4,5-dioxygenase family protein [Alphaproteobacteria bacterium]
MIKDGFNRDAKPASASLYHAHIYYKVGEQSEPDAKALAQLARKLFPQHVEEVIEYDKPGGPHAASNVVIHIKSEGFGEVVRWLQFNTGDLSALVHPKSGDVIKDHIDYGLWLGPHREGLLNGPYFDRKRAERGIKPPKQGQ